uniref:Bleomycin hydrolase n=1 Tax=Macrostomum lignano TaxID=282301 RepID=A0A1I8F9B6_9PLAT
MSSNAAAPSCSGIPNHLLAQLESQFSASGQLQLSETGHPQRHKLFDVALDRRLQAPSAFAYSAAEIKPVTDQKRSGRCWLFAALNLVRIRWPSSWDWPSWSCRKSHLFFWDKLERGYYFLHCYLDCAMRASRSRERLWQHPAVHNPAEDGARDAAVQFLVEHLAPQSAKRIRDLHAAGQTADQIRAYIDSDLLPELFRFCCAPSAGRRPSSPSSTRPRRLLPEAPPLRPDAAAGGNKYRRIGPVTPLQFYQEHVKPLVDLGAQELRRLATDALRDRLPVWFGSHVSKGHSRTAGLADPNLHRLDLLCGLQLNTMDKKERLLYGGLAYDSRYVAYWCDPPDPRAAPGKWRDAWFDEYVYEVAIDKARLTDKMRAVLEQDPIVLPAWDPMGALAQ